MPALINSHVARLHRFLPFSSAHDQIYEEYQTGEDNLDLETVAIDYAVQAIKAGAKCVILTGDAGHGKTHMCRRLIESRLLGHSAENARKYLIEACDASIPIPPANGVNSVALRIHKDLSEIQPPSNAAAILERIDQQSNESLVVCANEGRLRAIINSVGAGSICQSIKKLMDDSFQFGNTADTTGKIHIINLNYQSVAARSIGSNVSLLRRVLASWISDGRRWGERSCGACDHHEVCPIRLNRVLLAEQGPTSDLRIKRLEEIFEVIERLNVVVTIREMLMIVSYLITGGMSCTDVDKRITKSSQKIGWQHAWAFYNLLFTPPPGLPNERATKGIPLLAVLRRLDPGSIAVRKVDERILNRGDLFPPDQLDLQFFTSSNGSTSIADAAFGIDDFIGNDLLPTSRTKLRLVQSVKLEQDGHEEEQIYRRTNHWLSQTSRGWDAC